MDEQIGSNIHPQASYIKQYVSHQFATNSLTLTQDSAQLGHFKKRLMNNDSKAKVVITGNVKIIIGAVENTVSNMLPKIGKKCVQSA